MRAFWIAAVVVCVVVPAGWALGLDGPGDSIASAPDIVVGEQTTGSVDTRGWYRITLAAGDRLRIDFASLKGQDVMICMLRPNVTDFTLREAQCAASDSTDKRAQFRYTATQGGRWTMQIGEWFYGTTTDFQFTAYVSHPTRASISAPKLLAKGAEVTYTGKIAGLQTGRVALEIRKGNAKWVPFAAVDLHAGAFAYTSRISRPGTYTVRVVYPGDLSHVGSTASAKIKVI